MKRGWLLAVGAVVIIGATMALFMLIGGGGSDAEPTEPGGSAVASRPTAPVRGPDRPSPDRPGPTSTVTGVERNSAARPEEPPDEYEINGVRVRDHRKPEDRKPMDLPPNLHPPASRRIQPTLTGALGDQIQRLARECGAAVPKDALGTKPRVEGQIVIAIKDQKAVVTSAVFQLRDVSGTSADAAKACLEEKSLGVSSPAPDESDLDGYSINLSYAFP